MAPAGSSSSEVRPSESHRSVEDTRPREQQRAGGRKRGWPWLVGGLALATLKAQAFTGLLHHRVEVIALLGLWLAVCVLRPRPVRFAGAAGALVAFALGHRVTGLSVEVGFATFLVLLSVFLAIGTVLHHRPRPPRR